MTSKNESIVAIDIESQNVGRYIGSKIFDLRRGPRKSKREKNEDIILVDENTEQQEETDDNTDVEQIEIEEYENSETENETEDEKDIDNEDADEDAVKV